MKNIILLLQIAGLLLMWAFFAVLLIPCALAVWALKFIVRGLEWVRDRATGGA